MKYSLRILKNKNIFKKHNYPPPNAFIEHQIFLHHQLKPFFLWGRGGERVCVSLIYPFRNFKKTVYLKIFWMRHCLRYIGYKKVYYSQHITGWQYPNLPCNLILQLQNCMSNPNATVSVLFDSSPFRTC